VLLNQGTITHRPDGWEPTVVAGAALLRLGIPAVLPWLLERAVARLRGGRPAVQLAIRRLQLDSGTPARVVGGVAVVLAGAIALDAVLASQAAKYDVPSYLRVQHSDLVPTVQVYVEGADPAPVADGIRSVQGVRSAVMVRELTVDVDNGRSMYGLAVVDCETLLRYAAVKRCTDGDVFRPAGDRGGELTPGRTVTLRGSGGGTDRQTGVPWTVPGGIEEIDLAGNYIGYGTLLLTPGALGDVRVPASLGRVMVFADLGQPDLLERIRNTVVPYGSKVHVSAMYSTSRPETLDLLLTIRNGLLGGALFTLLLAGISMLVLALEQMRERRRPLAALAATGVPTGTLARSLLWQNTVPVLLAVVVAVITGIGLAGLVFRMIDEPFAMDWGSVAIYSGVATVLVLLVTAMTLPTLRSATRLAALRTE
jgi:hypothetical protein